MASPAPGWWPIEIQHSSPCLTPATTHKLAPAESTGRRAHPVPAISTRLCGAGRPATQAIPAGGTQFCRPAYPGTKGCRARCTRNQGRSAEADGRLAILIAIVMAIVMAVVIVGLTVTVIVSTHETDHRTAVARTPAARHRCVDPSITRGAGSNGRAWTVTIAPPAMTNVTTLIAHTVCAPELGTAGVSATLDESPPRALAQWPCAIAVMKAIDGTVLWPNQPLCGTKRAPRIYRQARGLRWAHVIELHAQGKQGWPGTRLPLAANDNTNQAWTFVVQLDDPIGQPTAQFPALRARRDHGKELQIFARATGQAIKHLDVHLTGIHAAPPLGIRQHRGARNANACQPRQVARWTEADNAADQLPMVPHTLAGHSSSRCWPALHVCQTGTTEQRHCLGPSMGHQRCDVAVAVAFGGRTRDTAVLCPRDGRGCAASRDVPLFSCTDDQASQRMRDYGLCRQHRPIDPTHGPCRTKPCRRSTWTTETRAYWPMIKPELMSAVALLSVTAMDPVERTAKTKNHAVANGHWHTAGDSDTCIPCAWRCHDYTGINHRTIDHKRCLQRRDLDEPVGCSVCGCIDIRVDRNRQLLTFEQGLCDHDVPKRGRYGTHRDTIHAIGVGHLNLARRFVNDKRRALSNDIGNVGRVAKCDERYTDHCARRSARTANQIATQRAQTRARDQGLPTVPAGPASLGLPEVQQCPVDPAVPETAVSRADDASARRPEKVDGHKWAWAQWRWLWR